MRVRVRVRTLYSVPGPSFARVEPREARGEVWGVELLPLRQARAHVVLRVLLAVRGVGRAAVPGAAQGVEPRGDSGGLRGPWPSGGGEGGGEGGGMGGGARRHERGCAEVSAAEVSTKVSAQVRTASAAAARRLAQAELAEQLGP